MGYLPKIQKAIKFSIKTHEVYQKQKRKFKDVAYITHPLTVGIILSGVGASDDVVMAGILHDTIEDSPKEKKVTVEMLKERFGKKVSEGVLSVTEIDKNIPWEERKKQALENISKFSKDSLLIKSADIIANISELVDDYARHGEKVFLSFNAPKEKVLGHQLEAIKAISKKWRKNPLLDNLQFLSEKIEIMRAINYNPKRNGKNYFGF